MEKFPYIDSEFARLSDYERGPEIDEHLIEWLDTHGHAQYILMPVNVIPKRDLPQEKRPPMELCGGEYIWLQGADVEIPIRIQDMMSASYGTKVNKMCHGNYPCCLWFGVQWLSRTEDPRPEHPWRIVRLQSVLSLAKHETFIWIKKNSG